MKKQYLGILFIFLFFPYGLFYIWKNKLWTIKTRFFISSFFILIIIFGLFQPEPSGNNLVESSVDKSTVIVSEKDKEARLLEEKKQAEIATLQKDKDEEEQRAKEENCKQDLSCWAEKHISYAGSYCDDQIQSRAQYEYKWENSWYENIFSHYKWKNKNNGILTYIGNKVKFQNGFGAFKTMHYECDFNPYTKEVLSVRLQ